MISACIKIFALAFMALLGREEAAFSVSVPSKVQEIKVGSLSAWILEDNRSPLIAMSFSFRAGSAFDPPGKEGLAMLYTSLFFQNRQHWKKEAFLKELETLGATFQNSCFQDYLCFSCQFPVENKEAVAKILQRLFKESQFEPMAFERYRDQLPGDIIITYTEGEVLGEKALNSLLFPHHPYGRSVNGTPEGVQAITLQDLEDFPKKRLTQDRLKVGLAGAITPESGRFLLKTCFGGLSETSSEGSSSLPKPPEGTPLDHPVFIEKHMSQSLIMVGQRFVLPSHQDWYASVILNYILGGSAFTSRLWVRLRDELGVTYGVQTGITPYAQAAFLEGGLKTDKENVGRVLEEIKHIWTSLRTQGVTARELDEAKSSLKAEIGAAMTNSSQIASILLGFQHKGYDPTYLEKRGQFIDRVTLEDVNRVSRELLDFSKLFVVVVGEKY